MVSCSDFHGGPELRFPTCLYFPETYLSGPFSCFLPNVTLTVLSPLFFFILSSAFCFRVAVEYHYLCIL